VWSNLPLQVALGRGATEIFALDLTLSRYPDTPVRGTVPTLWRMADIGVRAMRDRELLEGQTALGPALHHIELPSGLAALEFGGGSAGRLIEEGHWRTEYYLDLVECDSQADPSQVLSNRLESVCGSAAPTPEALAA
jgi:hypothetical protein